MIRLIGLRALSLLAAAGLAVLFSGATCKKPSFLGGSSGGGGGGAVGPVINLSQSSLSFATGTGGPDPAAQMVNLTNTGPATTLRWTTTSNQPWLAVTPLNGETTAGTSVLSIRTHVFATEQWNAATATAGAPSARENFSAAWTGTEMIVWGGYNGTVLGDGSRYNPVTNLWAAVTNTGAPAARRYHSAVWTGSRMLVWGGTNGADAPVNDGAFYDPTTDTWTGVTAALNAPAARRSHSAVWTGREMIIWNGLDKIDVGSGGLVLNDGKRYNPVTNTWSVAGLPTTNAPTGRYAHKAVWTGTEMIVWCGYNVIEGYMNTGGRFNPATNTWSATPVSTVGAPAARAYPALVWTGAEMLAWGGTPGGPGMQSGGRYNPATNTWSPITTTGAPVGSRELEGIWTGSEMIAWGGYTGSAFLNSGGRYQPPANLAAGAYTGTVTVSDPAATNNPRTITVNLTVDTPSLSVSTGAINYTVATDKIPTFTVDNTTGGAMNWTMTSDQTWLVPPESGTTVAGTPTTVTPGFHFTRMAAGTYTATLTVTAPGAVNSPQTIAVTLVVAPIDSFVASAAYLRTLYVSTTGNDTTGDGSVGAPFLTLHAACLVAQPGDIIQLLAGSFAGWPIGVADLSLTGTFANPIKIQGDPAGGTLINCALNSAINGIRISSSEFVLIQDLKIVGFSDHGVSLDGNLSGSPRGHHIILRNLTVQNGLATANEGIRLFEVDSSIVEACDIDLAIGSGVSAPLTIRHGFHDIVRNNYIHDSFRCGIKVRTQSKDLLIIGNKLENITDRGIELDGFRNAAVANLMVNVISPLVFEAAEEPLAANNTVYRARQVVLWFSTPVGDPYLTRNGRVVNNIFVFNNAELSNYANSGAGTFPATFLYQNNLWFSLDNPGFTGPTLAAAETGGKYQVNPQFGSVASGDFHLAVASGARASGLALTEVLRDFDGFLYATPRALGAFEGPNPVPTINLSNNTLSFNTPQGVNPAAQTVNLTNTGNAGSVLRWTAAATKPWFQATPFGGTTTTETDVLAVNVVLTQAEAWTGTTATSAAPTGRDDFSMVWTGKEMIVWGGYNGGTWFGNGGRYNPATNTWTTLSTTNAPTARRHQSAVWTGSRMIIWGGLPATDVAVNDGSLYDPVSNQWTGVTSTVNAPSARRSHSAVWTGTEMIVWSGYDQTSIQTDGRRYNPVTNTWSATPIATANAPVGRWAHRAIWTGTEMIVWGGYDGGSYVNTGGRYNPATDSWSATPVSTTSAPAARGVHGLVWTGSEMIVWGGTVGGSASQSGARYDPVTNTWLGATTLIGAPGGSAGLCASWTGKAMIVWGGGSSGTWFNTGAIYQPPINLTPGTYTDTISVNDPAASNNPQTIAVTLTVSANFCVAAMSPVPGSSGPAPVEIDVDCNTNVNAATVSGATVFLTRSGGDGTFSDGNEVGIVPNSLAVSGTNAKQIVIDLSGVSMPADTYRVTVTAAVTDTNATGLDGEFSGTFPSGNGVAGGNFTATFVVP